MLWIILLAIFVLYVIYRLSTIQYQLKLITKHLGIQEEKEESIVMSDEQIEEQLEEELKNKKPLQ